VTVNTAGTTTFTGTVGVTPAMLTSLTTDAAGTTAINGGLVATTVNQTYGDNVVLNSGTDTTTLTGVDMSFGGTVTSATDAEDALIVTGSGTTTFSGAVGGGTGTLFSLSSNGGGTTAINGGSVETDIVASGDQTYDDSVTIGANTTLTGNDITFNSTLDADATASDRTLAINTDGTGVTTFGDAVGGTERFESITTNADGTTVIDTSTFNTDGASITFNDPVTLGTDVVVDENGAGNVTFNSTVDSDGTARDLTVNTEGGNTVFNATVGVGSALNVLTTDNGTGDDITIINTTTINGAVLDFNDPVEVAVGTPAAAGTATLTGTTSVDFLMTVNSSVNENNNLSISSDIIGFHGRIGEASPLGTLMTDGNSAAAAGTTTFDTDQVNAAIVDINHAAVLEMTTTINGTTSVDFATTLDSAGGEANALTVNSPTTGFQGAVGTVDPSAGVTDSQLGSVTTDAAGTTAINGGAVRTSGFQLYQDDVTIGANADLTSTVNGAITFDKTLNGSFTLAINTGGTTTFNGVVGGTAEPISLTTDDDLTDGGAELTVFNTSAINADVVVINDALEIDQNVTVKADTSVNFNNTIDSSLTEANDLLVNSPSTTFGDATGDDLVGGKTPLGSLITDDQGGADTTTIDTSVVSGAILTFNDMVLIDRNTTLTGTSSVTFNNSLDSTPGENSDVVVNSPDTTFGNGVGDDHVGAIRALGSLTTDTQDPDDTTTINSTSVTTSSATGNTGDQTYADAVTLGTSGAGNDTTSLTGVNISFMSTIDGVAAGAQDLIVNATAMSVFGDGKGHDAVGGEFALGSVTTDGGVAASGTTTINATAVTTSVAGGNTGDQTYNDFVVVGSNDTGGATTTLTGNDVTFNNAVDGAAAGAQTLVVDTTGTGTTTFGGGAGSDNVGTGAAGGAALGNLMTNADGITIVNSAIVTTTATQTYNDDVILGTSGTGNVITTFNGTDLSFNDTVDAAVGGSQGMVANGTGVTKFGDAATDDNVGGENPAFAGSGALSSLTTDLAPAIVSGTTQINSATVNTTGDQTYNDAVNVGTSGTGNNVTTLNGNDITFNLTVDGDGTTASIEDLTVNSSTVGPDIGVATFGDAMGDDNVGGTTPLGNLITNADGETDINSTSVTTSADQIYHDDVIIGTSGAGALLTTLNGVNITFNGTVDADAAGIESLLVNGSGVTTFGDAALDDNVGGVNDNMAFVGSGALANLTTDDGVGADTTVINSAFVTTTLDQTYNDAVTLGTSGMGNVVTTFTGNNLTFNGTVDGAAAGTQDLVANSTGGGATTFGDGAGSDDVGATTALQNITTNADGTSVLNATSLTTTLDQTYNDPITVGTSGSGSALTTVNANDTTFNSTVDATTAGVESLTVNSSTVGADTGFTTFGDAAGDDNVGSGAALASLLTNVDGAVVINSTIVTTTVSQTHNDAAFLGTSGTGNTTTTLNGVAVSFNSTTDAVVAGAQSLIVNATGATTFGDGVGSDNVGVGDSAILVAGSGALAYLVTDESTGPVGPGTTVINSSVITTLAGSGDQTYNDAVILGSNSSVGGATTTLNGSDISFNSTVDATIAGLENLVVNSSDMVGELDVVAGVDGTLGTLDDMMVAGDGIGVTTFGLALVLGADGLAGTADDVPDGSDDNVGGVTALGTITTDADGTTVFNAALVNSFGDQTYNDNTVIAFSGTGIDTTTLTAIGTGAANVTVGTAPPVGTWVNGQTMTGMPLGNGIVPGIPVNHLVANADANVRVHSAISGIFSVNGKAGVSWIGPNPLNTAIRMYYSQPVAPFVFLFNAPPAQYRINQFLIDMGTLFSQDLQNLVRYPEVNYPVSQLDYNALREAQRQGLLPTDLILSTYDLFAEDEEEEE
jgi:hypothetical protein